MTVFSVSEISPPYNPTLKGCLYKTFPVSAPFKYSFPSASSSSYVSVPVINFLFSSAIASYFSVEAALFTP